MSRRGYKGIGMYEPKTMDNLSMLMRSATCFNADFIFTIGNRYKDKAPDTTRAFRHIPLYFYEDIPDFLAHLPENSSLVSVEITPDARPLESLIHPERAVYLLGGEDRTLPVDLLSVSDFICRIDTARCLNVAVAGSVVLYDREQKTVYNKAVGGVE